MRSISLLVFLLVFVLFSCEEKIEERNTFLTVNDSIQSSSVIKPELKKDDSLVSQIPFVDKRSHDFLNEVMLDPKDRLLERRKINDRLIQFDVSKLILPPSKGDSAQLYWYHPPPNSVAEVLNKYFNQDDMDYMRSQLDTCEVRWDEKRVLGGIVIQSKTIDSIFCQQTHYWIPKSNESPQNEYSLPAYFYTGKVTGDAWDYFKFKFGPYGLHSYSKPLFSVDGNYAVIEHSGQGHWTLGSGGIYIYHFENGRWTYVDKIPLWIS